MSKEYAYTGQVCLILNQARTDHTPSSLKLLSRTCQIHADVCMLVCPLCSY